MTEQSDELLRDAGAILSDIDALRDRVTRWLDAFAGVSVEPTMFDDYVDEDGVTWRLVGISRAAGDRAPGVRLYHLFSGREWKGVNAETLHAMTRKKSAAEK